MKSTTSLVILILGILTGACGQDRSAAAGPEQPVSTDVERPAAPAMPVRSQLDERTRQALVDALADERKAETMYTVVLERFGDVRPFSNIVNAEKRHEAVLLPLFQRYGVVVPENSFIKEKAEIPATLIDCCQLAIGGEQANIAMYDRFLEFVKEDDVRQAFKYLRDASENNHLPAFERCAQGRGSGNGRGRPF